MPSVDSPTLLRRVARFRPRPLTVLLGALAAGTVAALTAGSPSSMRAESRPQVRAEHLVLQVPFRGETYGVAIEMLLVDDGSGNYERQAKQSREAILQRFPQAREQPPGRIQSEFVTTGFWWPSRTTSWAYNATGKPAALSNDLSAITAGANNWNGAGGANWSFTGGGATAAGTGACGGSSSGLDNQNTVGWVPQSSNTLAITCSWFKQNSNPATAIEFDMELDPDWNWTTGNSGVQMDLQSVAVHEFGHALGLDHSQSSNCPGPVMCATYSQGTVNRTPTGDDVAGLVALYGTGSGSSTATSTRTATVTSTPTAAATKTPTSTPTSIATSCARYGCGQTATATRTATATQTVTSTATRTPTVIATSCPRGGCPAATATSTPTATVCPQRSACTASTANSAAEAEMDTSGGE